MPDQNGWTLVQPAQQADTSGWTMVQPAAAPPPASVDPSTWAQSFGRAALGALASQASPDVVQAVGDSVIGILKGAGHTAERLGQLVQKLPGVQTAVDAVYQKPGLSNAAFSAADQATTPTNTAQKVGYGAEQMGEFFVPAGAAEKGATALASKVAPAFTNTPRLVQAAAKIAPRMITEGATNAAVAGAQGGSPVAAGVMGAVAPAIGGAISAKTPALEESAGKQVEQFLGATKERYKAMAERLVPQILKRGIRGSRAGVLDQATAAAETAGQAVDDALQQFGTRSTDPNTIVNALEDAKQAFRTTAQRPLGDVLAENSRLADAGKPPRAILSVDGNTANVAVDIEPRALNQLDKLQDTIRQLGPDANVTQMVAIRRAWDSVVAQAGGYAQRAPGAVGMPLADTTEAWAKREGAGAIRKLLDADVPELTSVNKEYAFWKNLQDVLTQTTQRTGPQGPGLTREIAGAAGAAAGSGSGLGAAVALQKVGKLANQVFTSPRWRLASAQTKDALAKAIMGGNVGQISSVLGRVMAGGTSQATAGGGQP